MHHEFPLLDSDFRAIARLVMTSTGIVIDERKRAFIHGRLGRRLRLLGLPDFSAYCRLLEGPGGEAERHMLVNAVTTNHTSFFREPHHFDYLANAILPAIAETRSGAGRRLRIWSAGCSTGEEPYTIAMVLSGSRVPLSGWDVKLLATDLDTNVVAHAAAGIYDAERIKSIPMQYRQNHVMMQPDGNASMTPALRAMITFKSLNLLHDWPMAGPFDVIFCRNVVIYFDKPTQRDLFNRYADMLRSGGWLIVGHSESLQNLTDRFDLVGRTIYRRLK